MDKPRSECSPPADGQFARTVHKASTPGPAQISASGGRRRTVIATVGPSARPNECASPAGQPESVPLRDDLAAFRNVAGLLNEPQGRKSVADADQPNALVIGA